MNGIRYWSHSKLLSWMQRRCCICQRFLAKRQLKYCAKCKKTMHMKWAKTHPEYVKNYAKNYRLMNKERLNTNDRLRMRKYRNLQKRKGARRLN